MPIVDIDAPPIDAVLDTPQPVPLGAGELGGTSRPDTPSLLGAAFRTDNMAVSMFKDRIDDPYRRQEGYDGLARIKGTKYEKYIDSFYDIYNDQAHSQMERRIDKEEADNKLLDSAPWYMSFPARMVAGTLDLPSLLPGGAFVRGAKGGFSMARSGAAVGAAAGVATAGQEAFLQASQETRTASESTINIAASTFLGGLLGAGGAKLLTKGEWNRAVRIIEREVGTGIGDIERGMSGGSAGAASVAPTDLESNTIAGGAARAVGSATEILSPSLRTIQSDNPVTREVASGLAEMSFYLKKHFGEGPTSGPSVETLRKEWDGGLAQALVAIDREFKAHREAGGTLTRTQFREEAGKAMRTNDEHPDPNISKLAQAWRKEAFEPLKEAGIKAGLLPKDVTVETAPSYFSRMWDVNKLNANEQRAKGIFATHIGEKLLQAYEADRAAISGKLTEADQKLRKPLSEADFEKMHDEELKGILTDPVRQAAEILAGRRKATAPPSFVSWLAQQGGVKDPHGEILSALGGSHRTRPGLINKNGMSLDVEAADKIKQMAKGFFPERDVPGGGLPGDNDITRWISESLAGREPEWFLDAMTPERKAKVETTQAADRMAEQFHQAGIEINSVYDVAKALRDESVIAGRGITLADLENLHAGSAANAPARTEQAVAAARAKVLREFEDKWAVGAMGRGVDIAGGTPDFSAHVKEIVDDLFQKLTGRTDGVRPEWAPIGVAGPLKERTFDIPDKLVEEFLENDVERVGRRYVRVMSADVELASKFGSVDMLDQLTKIREMYAKMRTQVADDPKALARLEKGERDDIRDITGMRDIFRGVHLGSKVEDNYSRIVQAANQVNYIRLMGEAALASLGETIRPAMVHGLMPYMRILPKFIAQLDGIKMSIRESKLAGQIGEQALQHRIGVISETLEPSGRRNPGEAFLDNMTKVASKWNGLAMLTDMQQAIASVMTQDRILKNVVNYANLSDKERAYMRFLHIDESMAERIAKQWKGDIVDGVRVAGTEGWADDVARRTYRAAINKDVDSIIVTPGIGDVPLMANTPTGRAMLQFRRFALAANQRVLMRGLQEDQTRFLGGIIALTTIGMMVTYFKAISGNTPMPDIQKNPGWLIAEGLDRTGVLGPFMEASNTFEKVTGLNPLKTPIRSFDETSRISQKNQNRNIMGSVAGPSVGLIEDAAVAGGIPQRMASGEDVTKGQKNALERLMPYSSYVGIRQLLRYFFNPRDD